MNKDWGEGFKYNENNFKKNNYGTTQIKILKSIKRTNLGLSQHPPSEYYTGHRYISIHTLNIHRWNCFPISP